MDIVIFAFLPRVILALVTDQAVPALVNSPALIAGQRLRYIEVRVREVSLKRPCAREGFLTEAAVSAADRSARELKLLLRVPSGYLTDFRYRLSRLVSLREPTGIADR